MSVSGGYRIVLTGAAGGLGRHVALELAPASRAMVLCGRDEHRLSVLGSELRERNAGLRLELVCGDLAGREARERICAAAAQLEGGPDVLINNAADNAFHDFGSQSEQELERLLAVNLLAPMLLTRALLPQLMRAAPAQVVNVGSILGYIGYPGNAAYCAGKFGLRGFTEALHRELDGSGVRARYFAPRAMSTPLNSAAVTGLNRALGNAEDDPTAVARELRDFLQARERERRLGFPERLYVLLNQLVPGLNDRAIRGQLPVIRQFLPRHPAAAADMKEQQP